MNAKAWRQARAHYVGHENELRVEKSDKTLQKIGRMVRCCCICSGLHELQQSGRRGKELCKVLRPPGCGGTNALKASQMLQFCNVTQYRSRN